MFWGWVRVRAGLFYPFDKATRYNYSAAHSGGILCNIHMVLWLTLIILSFYVASIISLFPFILFLRSSMNPSLFVFLAALLPPPHLLLSCPVLFRIWFSYLFCDFTGGRDKRCLAGFPEEDNCLFSLLSSLYPWFFKTRGNCIIY